MQETLRHLDASVLGEPNELESQLTLGRGPFDNARHRS